MKKTSYIFSIILAAGLFSASVGSGLAANYKEKDKETVKEQPNPAITTVAKQGNETKSSTESVWLNKRNFPQLQDSACPFYMKPVGC